MIVAQGAFRPTSIVLALSTYWRYNDTITEVKQTNVKTTALLTASTMIVGLY